MSRRFSRFIAITGSVSVGFVLGSILAFAQTWSRPVNAPPLLNAGQPPAGVQYTDFLLKSPTTLQTLQGRITAANVSSVKVGAGGVNSSIGLSAVNSFSAPAYPSGSIGLFSYDQGSSYSLFAAAGGTGSASALVGKADTGGTAGKFVGPVTVSENGSALGTVAVDGAATTTVGLKCLESAGCSWPGSAATILVGTNTAGGTAVYSYSPNNTAIYASIARTGGSWATGAAYGYSQYGYGLGGSGSTGVYASAIGSNTTIGLAGFLDTGSGLEIFQQRKGVYGLSDGGVGNTVSYTASPPNHDFAAGIRACVKDAAGTAMNQEGIYGSGGRFAGYFDGATQCFSADTFTVDSAGNVGASNSIAIPPTNISNRYPIIAYYDQYDQSGQPTFNLKVVKCGNDTCTSGNNFTWPDTDTAADVGGYTRIAVPSDGRPVISYYDFTNSRIKILKCANESCTSVTNIAIVATGSSIQRDHDMVLDATGIPLVAYAYTGGGGSRGLWVFKCGNVDCTSGNQSFHPVTASSIDAPVAIDLISGNPVIMYYQSGDLMYLKCGNPTCSSGNAAPVTVDAFSGGAILGNSIDLAISTDSKPVVVYHEMDGSARRMKVAKCSDANITCAGVVPNTVDLNSTIGFPDRLSMVIPSDNRPIIALGEYNTGGTLDVQRCVNSDCTPTCGATCTATTLVRRLSVLNTWFTSIALGSDGLPVIAHGNRVIDDLLVTKCYDLDCTISACTVQGGKVMIAGTGLVAPTKGAVLKIGNTYLTKCNLIGMLRKAGYTQYSACP